MPKPLEPFRPSTLPREALENIDPGPEPMAKPQSSMNNMRRQSLSQDDLDRYGQEMDKITGNRPLLTEYQKQLLAPDPEDKPSWKRRLLAGVAGAAAGVGAGDSNTGFLAANRFVHKPYEDAIQRRDAGIVRLGKAATVEDKFIIDRIDALREARELGLKYDEFELKRLEAIAKDEVEKGKLGVEQGNLKVNEGRGAAYGRDIESQIQNRGRTGDQKDTELGISAYNAETARGNSASLQSYRNAMAAIGNKNAEANITRANKAGRLTETQKGALMDNVIKEMQMDPTYKDFIDMSSGYPAVRTGDVSSRSYRSFLSEFQRRAQKAARDFVPEDLNDVNLPESEIEFLNPGGTR
jgi:hypothetical protein